MQSKFDSKLSSFFRWGTTFLLTDSRLSEEERFYLADEATKMYLNEQEERKIQDEAYEIFGRLYLKKKCIFLGTYCGPQFDAKITTRHGKSRLSFLVSEHTIDRFRDN